MSDDRITECPSWNDPRGQAMKTPDDVSEMLRLKACGWGMKRIGRRHIVAQQSSTPPGHAIDLTGADCACGRAFVDQALDCCHALEAGLERIAVGIALGMWG